MATCRSLLAGVVLVWLQTVAQTEGAAKTAVSTESAVKTAVSTEDAVKQR